MLKTNRGSGPTTNHTTKATIATAITMGTKTPATWSASRWIGALVPCAASTSRTICASAVSLPTASVRTIAEPAPFTVPPISRSPGCFSTGSGSPVSMASSTAVVPSRIVPSTGIVSPGRTITRSPTTTSSTGISRSCPSRCTRAVLGLSARSCWMAADVCPLARASSSRPSRISAMMPLTAS